MCDEEFVKKKLFLGTIILVFGFLWFLRDMNVIGWLEPFWPLMTMALGIIILLKVMFCCKTTKKRR